MTVRARGWLVLTGVFAMMVAATVQASALFAEVLATRDTVALLKQGGYVLYLVEGKTELSRPDRTPGADLTNCSAQRPLTTEGRRQMQQVGEALRRARIPVTEVRVSPACRSVDAAEAAFGRTYAIDERFLYAASMTTEAKQPLLNALRRWMSAPVAATANRVLVGQPQPLVDLLGYFPEAGTVVILRPAEGKRFDYVASMPISRWGMVAP